jgi:hypothetical protein
MASNKCDFVVCVAMDIGTTYSSYAYSFKGNEDQVNWCDKWGNNLGVVNSKAPTVVLVDKLGQFVAFGYDALEKYNNMSEGEAKNHHLYQRFKMKLMRQKVSNLFIRFRTLFEL